eukprot:m.20325 g.20325  ORF g.20325 m.20325 type:complete len:338 (-) comp7800_c0_seq1:37-1050(-)
MVLIQVAEPHEIFNLSLFDSHIVVDLRPREQYDKARLVSSLSCPALPPPYTDALATQLVHKFSEMINAAPPERYNVVVLVHGTTELSMDFAQFLASRLQTALARALPAEASAGQAAEDEDSESFVQAVPRHAASGLPAPLFTKCERILLLQYEAFERFAPALCRPIAWTATNPTPRFICPELFTSSRGSVFEEYWSDFHFTHFITHAHPHVVNEFPSGMPCLCCDVPDRPDYNVSALLSATAEYVAHAARAGGRVLLRIRGRTVSSACAVAYLCVCGQPLPAALATVAAAYGLKGISLADTITDWVYRDLPGVLERLRNPSHAPLLGTTLLALPAAP